VRESERARGEERRGKGGERENKREKERRRERQRDRERAGVEGYKGVRVRGSKYTKGDPQLTHTHIQLGYRALYPSPFSLRGVRVRGLSFLPGKKKSSITKCFSHDTHH